MTTRRRELADELAREIDVDIEELLVAIDRVRTSTNPRRRAHDAIGSPYQTTLQGPALVDGLRADGGDRRG